MSYDRVHLSSITLAAVLWGTTGVAVALLRDRTSLDPATIGFYRLAVAAAVLLAGAAAVRRIRPLTRARGQAGSPLEASPARPGILRTAPLRLLATGVLLGGYQALYFAAVVNTGVGVATVVSLGLAPVVTVTWEAVRARVRPGAGTVTTLAAALTGLTLITMASTEPGGHAPRPVLGLLAAVGAGLGYAASALLSRDLSQRADARTLTTVTSAVGAAALAPLAVTGGAAFPVRADTVALLLFLGVVTTAIAYALFYAGLRTVPGSVAAVLTLLEPLTAALLAVVLLGEPLPGLTVAGGLLLLSAVAALYLTPRTAGRAGRPARRARPAGQRPGRAC
jgi:DME family drug/metabolite transporter